MFGKQVTRIGLIMMLAILASVSQVIALEDIEELDVDWDGGCSSDFGRIDVYIEGEFFFGDVEINDNDNDVYGIKVFDATGRSLIPADDDDEDSGSVDYELRNENIGNIKDEYEMKVFHATRNPITFEVYEAVDVERSGGRTTGRLGQFLASVQFDSDCPKEDSGSSYSDGRINNSLELVVYCRSGGNVEVWDVANGVGSYAFTATSDQINVGIQQAISSGQNIQITAGPRGTGLWALSSFELQATLRDPARPEANVIFDADRCGSISDQTRNTQPAAVVTQPTVQVEQTEATGGQVGCPNPYVVQSGDNFFRIAVDCGVTVEALAQANGITDPTSIVPGQQLVVPSG